jgi:hypothetical protein
MQLTGKLLETIMAVPAIAEAIKQHQDQENDADTAKRAALIDQLITAEAAMPKLEIAMARQQEVHDRAQEAYHQERGRLGNVTQKFNEGQRAVQSAINRLRQFGGQEIDDADRRITLAIARCTGELEMREMFQPSRSVTGVIIDPDAAEDNRLALGNLKRTLVTMREALASLQQMRTAKLSPVEIREQVAAIEESCGIHE